MRGLMLECAVRSDVGPVRANNEDVVFASPRLVAVADGVGGAAAGEVASRTDDTFVRRLVDIGALSAGQVREHPQRSLVRVLPRRDPAAAW